MNRRDLLAGVVASTAASQISLEASAAETLTKEAVLRTLSQLGFTAGAVVPLGSSNYRLKKVDVERRSSGDFAIVFAADPV
jgi:hypothetical protein